MGVRVRPSGMVRQG